MSDPHETFAAVVGLRLARRTATGDEARRLDATIERLDAQFRDDTMGNPLPVMQGYLATTADRRDDLAAAAVTEGRAMTSQELTDYDTLTRRMSLVSEDVARLAHEARMEVSAALAAGAVVGQPGDGRPRD